MRRVCAAGFSAVISACFAAPEQIDCETIDAETQTIRVSWTMPEGATSTSWEAYTTTESGGAANSEAIWRETFDSVNAVSTTQKIDDGAISEMGLDGWEARNVRRTTADGVLIAGWEKSASGFLLSPPLPAGADAAAEIAISAGSRDIASGVMPFLIVRGGVTSTLAKVEIAKVPAGFKPLHEYRIQLSSPLAAGDRFLLHSLTNKASRATVFGGIGIFADGKYVPPCTSTNIISSVQASDASSVELQHPGNGAKLWIKLDTGDGWSPPFEVTTTGSGSAGGTEGGSGGNSGGEGGTGGGEGSTAAKPDRIAAALLADGSVRIYWTNPKDATNVVVRVEKAEWSGGLGAEGSEMLWDEQFGAAPKTNSTIAVNNATKWNSYSGLGPSVWMAGSTNVYLSRIAAGTLQVGKSDASGTLEASLALQGVALAEGDKLVVSAWRGYAESGDTVAAELVRLTDGIPVATNILGTAKLSDDPPCEISFPLPAEVVGPFRLAIHSPTNKADGRMVVDRVAIVREYVPLKATITDTHIQNAALAPHCDLSSAPGATRLVSLKAQYADGSESDWTEPVEIEDSELPPWNEKSVFLSGGSVAAEFSPANLPHEGENLFLTNSAFGILHENNGQDLLKQTDPTKQLSRGVYWYDKFNKRWAFLVPRSPNNNSEICDAELRLEIGTGAYSLDSLELEGEFAQLCATNSQPKKLEVQWREISKSGQEGDWQTFGEYASTYTASDADPDLPGTMTNAVFTASPGAKAGSKVQVRVYCRKYNNSGREAPLGFGRIAISAAGTGRNFRFIIR